jgi:ABC-type multidrug transport system fused ATPase/permease subunit
MQKRVVNEAIKLRKMDLLLLYCGIYLGAVILASGLKYLINIIQTLISQRVLADMRKDLYHHILTLPLNFFRKTQPGLVVNALVSELTTSSNFAGMAIAVPITNILTLLAFAGYLLWLNWLLALVSLSIYPLVLFLVPLLQKRANKQNKQRVDVARKLSSRIGEAISGIHEIQGNGSYRIESDKYNSLVDRLLRIRIIWTLYTQGVKVLNNFFNNLSPFLIFILGGYLAMNGRLELGALVAFLSAQEKLYDPWKEMIEFYQVYQDATVRYKRAMDYFSVMPEHALAPVDRDPYDLSGTLEVKGVSFLTDSGIRLLNNINLDLSAGEHLALVGFSGSGKSTLAQCVGQLYSYTDGKIQIGGEEVAEMSKKDMVANTGFVAQSPFIFEGTIEDNLLYAVRASTEGEPGDDSWKPSLDDMIAVLQQTGIYVDVLRFGLNSVLDPEKDTELMKTLIRVRKGFQDEFGEALADYVEFFNEDQYLFYSTVAENLIFGTPNDEEFAFANLQHNPFFLAFLKEADLTRPLLNLGAELSRQTVDILGNLPPDEVFFEQSPIRPEELDDYKMLVERLKQKKLHELEDADHGMLLELALRFTPGRHKMAGLSSFLESLILEGRALFRDRITEHKPEALTFYQMDSYIQSETILNNIFYGKTKTNNSRIQERIGRNINMLLIEEDIFETIMAIGMQFNVGSKGDRLSGGQRQKLAIARIFLKRPTLMIMDEATSALDNKSQARIQNLLDSQWKGKTTIIAVIHRLDLLKSYDRVAVMKAGKLVEIGTYDELIEKKGLLYELEFGKQ